MENGDLAILINPKQKFILKVAPKLKGDKNFLVVFMYRHLGIFMAPEQDVPVVVLSGRECWHGAHSFFANVTMAFLNARMGEVAQNERRHVRGATKIIKLPR